MTARAITDMQPLRILWAMPYLPWPVTSGGKSRQYHLLKALEKRGHHVTLLVQSKSEATPEALATLGALTDRVIVLPRRPLKHPVSILWTLFGPQPLLVAVNGHAPELTRAVQNLMVEHWDIVQIEHSYSCQPYLKALRRSGHGFVLTEHNIESSLCDATYDKLPRWFHPLAAWDRKRYLRWERRVFGLAEQVIAVTDADARVIARATDKPVGVVVNGVDAAKFAGVVPDPSARRILFVGNYEYAPNIAAVEWALSAIMPLVWEHYPETRFAVCGYALPARWRSQFPDPRIEWHGFVKDLMEIQGRSTLFLAPLRDGGGSKLKVLEAMAASLPLVSTHEGISGLSLQQGSDALIGADASDLARHVVTLLGDPDLARRLGTSGRAYAARRHDWSVAASELEDIYRQLLEARAQRPKK